MKRTVAIGNDRVSLVLALPDSGMPEIVEFGPGPSDHGIGPTAERANRTNGMDVAVPTAVMLPTGGAGFFGWPALCGHRDGRDFVAVFGSWGATVDGDETTLTGTDDIARLTLSVSFRVYPSGILGMRTVLRNEGTDGYTLDRLMAGTVLLPEGDLDLTTFPGMWGREMHARTAPLAGGLWMQENRRGRTSHDRWPGLFADGGGVSFGIHLGWSGNHVMAIDTLDDGRRLLHAGELFEPGEVRLASGESWSTPTVYACAVVRDVEAAAACFRRFVADELVDWPGGAMAPRPVTLNTWEGNYFDHRIEALKAQAGAAARLGVERFVLDDGWFGRRDDDTTSLGDWQVDPRKYPDGLGPLVEHVTGLGMQFGIWFEPEMVNPDSNLLRAHPDWVLQILGRPPLTSRHQLVLDLTRAEVSEHLFGCIDAVLSRHAVAYVKWDMNRDLTHAGGSDGRAAVARQTRAVHALMDRVRRAHPAVEIESCASGGGRMDFGVLRHTHRVWTSDGTDALERLPIQHGTAHFLPPQVMGAHVSAVPNHQTHRRHTLAFRAVVALAYHFGIELDPTRLTPGEADELAAWIALHKRLRPLLHGGGFFQLPPHDGRHVWGACSPDRIAVFVAQGDQMMAEQPPPLRVTAAGAPAGHWRVASCHPAAPDFKRTSEGQERLLRGEIAFSLASLRRVGLPLPALMPESGLVLVLERIRGESDHG
jgi:alpha-galactosidase